MKLLLLLPFLAVSCGIIPTTADLRDIADELDAYQMGYQTQEETVLALDAKVDEIGDRKTPIPTSLPELIMLLGTAAVGGGGANLYRNRKRVAKGEAV